MLAKTKLIFVPEQSRGKSLATNRSYCEMVQMHSVDVYYFEGIFDRSLLLAYNFIGIRSDSGNRIRQPAVGDGKVP